MTRQEIRSVQKNDSTPSTEEYALPAQPGQAPVRSAAPESLEHKPRRSDEQHASSPPSTEHEGSVEEEANTDADEERRVPLPSYSTLFHEGVTFGQSRGSWIREENSAADGSQLGATPERQQDSERS